MSEKEPNVFQNAVFQGDAGLVGTDGSGNDWEFSENLVSVALVDVIEDAVVVGDKQ